MEKTIACIVLVICFILMFWAMYAAHHRDFGFSLLLLVIVGGILCIMLDRQRFLNGGDLFKNFRNVHTFNNNCDMEWW